MNDGMLQGGPRYYTAQSSPWKVEYSRAFIPGEIGRTNQHTTVSLQMHLGTRDKYYARGHRSSTYVPIRNQTPRTTDDTESRDDRAVEKGTAAAARPETDDE
jgi:hypothetical protein